MTKKTKKADKKSRGLKVLFLDIDGVLNHDGMPGWPTAAEWKEGVATSYPEAFLKKMLEAGRVDLLKNIEGAVPGLKVVVHSTWRKILPKRKLLSLLSELTSIPVGRFDTAPFKMSSTRSYEIEMWIRDNDEAGEGTYAILDDERLYLPAGDDAHHDAEGNEKWSRLDLDGGFFRTDPAVGLTPDIADKVIARLLGGKEKVKKGTEKTAGTEKAKKA
jgi:hypothetical protein